MCMYICIHIIMFDTPYKLMKCINTKIGRKSLILLFTCIKIRLESNNSASIDNKQIFDRLVSDLLMDCDQLVHQQEDMH